MALTDIFTGAAQQKAAEQQRQYLAGQQAQVNTGAQQAQTTGLDWLKQAQTGGLAALQSGTATGRGDVAGSLDAATQALYGGQNAGVGALTQGQVTGLGLLQGGVDQARAGYAPLSQAASQYGLNAGQASQASADALGLNGPEGVARAQAQFQAGPGYQFGLNQGLESIARNANATGMGAGGNQSVDALKYGIGYANQEFDKYRTALSGREQLYAPLQSGALNQAAGGLANASLTGGTGGANIATGTAAQLSNLYGSTGQNVANANLTAGKTLADLAQGGGIAAAGLYNSTGGAGAGLVGNIYGTQTGYAGQQVKPYADTYQQEAAAATGGAQNLMNLIGAGATFGAGGGFNPTSWMTPTARPTTVRS